MKALLCRHTQASSRARSIVSNTLSRKRGSREFSGGGCSKVLSQNLSHISNAYYFLFLCITSSRGSFVTLARDIPAFSSYFMTYELLRERFKESDGSLGLGSTAVIGGLSGVVGWAVEIPLDALKSRHQGCLRYDTRKRPFMKGYSNFFFRKRPLSATIREVWHEGGPRVLFRGSGVILLRAIPANSVTFIGYEWTMKALVLLSYETVTSD